MQTNYMSVIRSKTIIGALACGFGLAACASPPPELKDARATYKEVSTGEAPEYAPAELKEAENALRLAETAFEEEGEEEPTPTLAYRAKRKAQIASVEAQSYQARRATEDRKQKLLAISEEAREQLSTELQERGQKAQMTAQELQAERQRLERLQSELEAAKAKGELTEAQLAEKRESLAVAQTKLEMEREARLEAQKKLEEARKRLEEVAQIKEDKDEMVITLTGEVLFEVGKANLRETAKRRLEQVTTVLLDKRDAEIIVEGHTDSQGADAMNQKLSQERAESVRTYLVSQGIAPDRITAVGKGESDPVAPNDSPEGRANNRRVEIVVKKAQQSS